MIENLINPDSIIFELSSEERDEVLAELTENIVSQDSSLNRKEIFQSLLEREDKMSTAVEKMMAVPHVVCKSVEKTLVSLGLSHNGINFDLSSENEGSNTVKIFFCMVFPENKSEEHLVLLKDILQLSREPDFLQKMLLCNDSREVCDLIYSFFI